MALLPKISDALAKFVAPVSQTATQTQAQLDSHLTPAQKQAAAKAAKSGKKEATKRPDLKLVPPISREPDDSDAENQQEAPQNGFQRFQPKGAEAAAEEGVPAPTQDPLPAEGKSVAAKIVDIFRLFQDGKKSLAQSSGSQVYKDMTKDEQKGKFRRGAMLDEKIE